MGQIISNPILPGFYPDPSICRKGEDYYLVTSTFEYFPGVPVFYSRDLVHWRQVGHCLSRPEQFDLHGLNCSKGIYAPTIRYHAEEDLFYMITTMVKNGPYRENVNFFVTAKDPAGPWSDPVVVQGAEGIDPTIFFDPVSRKTYYLGNLRPEPDAQPNGRRHIWLQELDVSNGCLLGERVILRTDGALYGARCPEGPHLYYHQGWYYLLLAEGGTAKNHSVTVFRSREIEGPYEPNPRNPLMTHRNLGRGYAIGCTGHADLFMTSQGQWWAVLLGTRPVEDMERGNLGRETFLVPVIWEEEWPVFCADTGRVEFSYSAPDLLPYYGQEPPACDQFEGQELALCWVMPRTPEGQVYSLTQRPGWLRLFLKPHSLEAEENVAFLARRQQHMCFAARTKMDFLPQRSGETAGMVALLSNQQYLCMEYTLWENKPTLRLVVREGETKRVEAQTDLEKAPSTLWLKITARYQTYGFFYALKPEEWQPLLEQTDGRLLSVERGGGYTGTMIGIFASANGRQSQAFADFDWFEYQPLEN